MAETTTVSARKGNDGFWGKVTSGLGEGIGTIGRDLAPIWAASQLKLQQFDQLDQSTFDGSRSAPRSDDKLATTGGVTIGAADQIAGIDRTSLMIVGGGLLLAFAVFFIARN